MTDLRIAIYSLTRDRLEFTRPCFESLWKNAGRTFDHYVLDNGSRDATPRWLRENEARFKKVVFSETNLGIARACNRLLDLIAEEGGYDLVIKIDNDCEILTPNVLGELASVLTSDRDWRTKLVLSPRVLGLVHQPSRSRYVGIGGRKVGITGMVGGIFLPVSWDLLKDFRYPEDLPLGSGDDVHLCATLRERGCTIGYVEDLEVKHYLTTVGQWNVERRYFSRKEEEARGAGTTAASGLTVREVEPEQREGRLPVTVVVPLSASRRPFFEEKCLPALLANRPERIVVVEGDAGASAKRNAGFAQVQSPFVFFCDDDVVLEQDCLARLHDALAATGEKAGYAYCDYEGLCIPPGTHPLGERFSHEGKPFDAASLQRLNLASTMSLVRSEIFPGFDESLERLQDWDLWLTLLDRGIEGVYVPGTLFTAYYLDEGITQRVDGEAAQSLVRAKHRLDQVQDGSDDVHAATARTVELLQDLAKPYHMRRIVELGTGSGRSLAALLAKSQPWAHVWSVEHDRRFLEPIAAALTASPDASARVTLVHAPIDDPSAWYANGSLDQIAGPIDLLVVDGPSGGEAKEPALETFLDRLSPRAGIVLNDCHRQDERRVLGRWVEILRARGLELITDIYPTDRGLGRIQLLGATEPSPSCVEPNTRNALPRPSWVVDADDFHEGNSGLELLFRIKGAIPNFKITLFTVVGKCSEAFLRAVRGLDWVDLVPHGWLHDTSVECRDWTYERSREYLQQIERWGLTKGFKAPGWQISDGMYRALLESGYWVADQRYNDHRRPPELRAYMLEDPNGRPYAERRHYHVQNACGNGLAERLEEILALEGEFAFVRDVVDGAAREPALDQRPRSARNPMSAMRSVEKALVYMDEGIGNMVMLTPTLRALKELDPKVQIDVMGKRPALAVIDDREVVHRTIAEDDRPDPHYDVLLATAFSGSAGHRLRDVRFTREPLVAAALTLDRHESEQHLELARRLGYTGSAPAPFCAVGPSPLPSRNGRKRVGLLDSASHLPEWERKRYPHYRELARALCHRGFDVLAFGDQGDAARYRDRPWPEGVTNLQGRLDVLASAGAFKDLDAVVANDCGPAHMAAAIGVPTLVLWGPTSRAKNEPRGPRVKVLSKNLPCAPCQETARWQECSSWQCLSSITPEEVVGELEALLREDDPSAARSAKDYWSERARAHGKLAVGYAGHSDERFQSTTELLRQKLFPALRALVGPSDKVALDFGCGWGRFSGELARALGGRTIGLDASNELLSLSTSDPNVELRACSRLSRFPLDDASVDVVFTCTVLQHIVSDPELQHVKSEFRRVLKPGGLLFLFENVASCASKPDIVFRRVAEYKALFPWAALGTGPVFSIEGEAHAVLHGRKKETA